MHTRTTKPVTARSRRGRRKPSASCDQRTKPIVSTAPLNICQRCQAIAPSTVGAALRPCTQIAMPATPIAATASHRCAISLRRCAWIHACNSAVKIGTTTVATNNALHIADSIGRTAPGVKRCGRRVVRASPAGGEPDGDDGAVRTALHVDLAVVTRHDESGQGEAQSRAAPLRLGRERRLEDLAQHVGGNSRAVVLHGDRDAAAGVARAQQDAPGPFTRIGSRVDRVQRQVERDLPEQARAAPDRQG